MRKTSTHPDAPVLSVVAVLILVLSVPLAGCGKSARERQEEYGRRATALNTFDAQAVLAGRDPATVLVAALKAGGCVWLSKGLLSASKNRNVVVDASYIRESNSFRLEKYSDTPWGPGKTHRSTNVATIPIDNLNSYIRPPHHSGEYQCWTVHFDCPEKDCMEYTRHSELIGSGGSTPQGSEGGLCTYWNLTFSDREAAVEACAALRVLSGRSE